MLYNASSAQSIIQLLLRSTYRLVTGSYKICYNAFIRNSGKICRIGLCLVRAETLLEIVVKYVGLGCVLCVRKHLQATLSSQKDEARLRNKIPFPVLH